MKKQTNLTIEKDVVIESKKKIHSLGGKLSGLVENLLIKFNKGEIKV